MSTEQSGSARIKCDNTTSVDIEAAIADLQSNANEASLELPSMLSAEQRKHIKNIVAKYSDLKCESFGFGADRQLLVFKSSMRVVSSNKNNAACPSRQQVSVKNTFIDDWIRADNMPADARVVQSMPHNMFGQCLSEELSGHYLQTNDCDPAASSSKRIEEISCISDKVAEESAREASIAVGSAVVVEGLVKAPHFNGAIGVVHSWDDASGRYDVLLRATTAFEQCWAKIKGEHLRLH